MEGTFATHVKELKVYAKSYALARQIHELSLTFPKYEQYSMADQFRRSSRSICANVAEGFGKQRFSKAEFKRFLSIAIGSVVESAVWNDFAYDFQYLSNEQHATISQELAAIESLLG